MAKNKKKKKHRIRNTVLGIVAALAAAFAIFFGCFYITDVEVSGNTRYTDRQIEQMCIRDFLSHNSIILSRFRKRIRPDSAFIDFIDVEYQSRNEVRLNVSEKFPIGYLEQDGNRFYFDKDGTVLEIMTDQEALGKQAKSTASASSEGTAGNSSENAGNEASASSDNSAESGSDHTGSVKSSSQNSGSTEKTGSGNEQTGFVPALTDVPRITGFSADGLKEGDQVPAKDRSVFRTIQTLTKLIDKFNVMPDQVELDSDYNMTLYFGNARISLGDGTNLEEKMTRAAAILPQIREMSGVLHLEDYTREVHNIIFDPDDTSDDTASEDTSG